MDREQYAYGTGYVAALLNVANDLHTQAHVEFDERGNLDPRGVAFFETYKILETRATDIKKQLDQDYLEAQNNGPS